MKKDGKEQVCYSLYGTVVHQIVKFGDNLQSKCGLISDVGQRYWYEFVVIDVNDSDIVNMPICKLCQRLR